MSSRTLGIALGEGRMSVQSLFNLSSQTYVFCYKTSYSVMVTWYVQYFHFGWISLDGTISISGLSYKF